jgi:hypothetical protein
VKHKTAGTDCSRWEVTEGQNNERKLNKMKSKILQKAFLILIAGIGALLATTTAYPQNLVAWESNVRGLRLVSQSCNGGVCDFVFEGSGAVSIMGQVTVTTHVVQDFNVTPCNTGIAEATFVGATGSVTYTYTCGSVCPSATRFGGPYTIQGIWNITAGTGQFSEIVGSGSDQGTIAGNGPNVHSSGVVVY